jgi:Fe-S-cluster-containing dehydrogenase component
MTQYAIVTDVNRCVGCLACSVACKALNGVPVGNFWNKTLRIGPNPKYEGAQWPDVDMYFLTVQCQHCEDPECVKVCPTQASHKLEDGTVQIDKAKCIGCQFCVMSCPYGVRYLNEEERVVEKCTLCEPKISQGELPACVAQCGGRARFFGDLEQGIENFEAPYTVDITEGDPSYDKTVNNRIKLKDIVRDYSDDQVHMLTNVGNNPSFRYIVRKHIWQGEE